MSGKDWQAWEQKLERDLPRGYKARPMMGGERGHQATWLPPEQMQGKLWSAAPDTLVVGRRAGRVIGWNDDRHVFTTAGSRAGKGVSLIIPNLLHYAGSALVIDCKGELAYYTAARRGSGEGLSAPGLGQAVHVLDPFDASKWPVKASFNPLGELRWDSPHLIDDAGAFASALVIHPDQGERHWTESAQAILKALILMVVRDPDPQRRNLLTVRRLLLLTDTKIVDKQRSMRNRDSETTDKAALFALLLDEGGDAAGDICAGLGRRLMNMGEEEFGSVMSSVLTQTEWLDSPALQPVLASSKYANGSSFDIAGLKHGAMTVYLCLPATRMGTHSRWLRLMISLALIAMERERATTPRPPTLFMLDEFPILGHMQSVLDAVGQMAGFGVKMWFVVQELGRLQQIYKESWSSFIGNAGLVTAFANRDSATLQELARMLGRTDVEAKGRSGAGGDQVRSGVPAFNRQRIEAGLLSEDELQTIFGRDEDRLLLLPAGLKSAIVQRFKYYEDEQFAGMFPPYRMG